MNANRMVTWLAVLVCGVSMTSAPAAAQNAVPPVPVVVTRPAVAPLVVSTQPVVSPSGVSPYVVSTRPGAAPLANLYWQQQSRIRLGLYLDADQSRRFDRDGALVTGVMRNSPADEAGLEEGDVITVFEGQVLTVPLPDIELTDIGADDEGSTFGESMKVVFQAINQGIVTSVSQSGSAVGEQLQNVGESAKKSLGGLLQGLKKAADGEEE